MCKTIVLGSVALAALLLVTPFASATLLPPGSTLVPVPLETITGTVLTSQTQNFSFAGDAGSVFSEVIRTDAGAGNPFGAGKITFAFQVTVTAGNVEKITDGSLAGALVDVGQTANGGTAPTLTADRTVDGSTVSFNWPGAAAITSTNGPSFLVYINTNQTEFSGGSLGVIDSGGETLAGYGIIPEPASMALALAGLPCLALGRWLRRKWA